jgi:hypothetical protein
MQITKFYSNDVELYTCIGPVRWLAMAAGAMASASASFIISHWA